MLVPGTLLYRCHPAPAVLGCAAMKCRQLFVLADLTTAVALSVTCKLNLKQGQCWKHSHGGARGFLLLSAIFKMPKELTRDKGACWCSFCAQRVAPEQYMRCCRRCTRRHR